SAPCLPATRRGAEHRARERPAACPPGSRARLDTRRTTPRVSLGSATPPRHRSHRTLVDSETASASTSLQKQLGQVLAGPAVATPGRPPTVISSAVLTERSSAPL